MFKVIIGKRIEIAYELGGLYLRIGARDWYWSRKEA